MPQLLLDVSEPNDAQPLLNPSVDDTELETVVSQPVALDMPGNLEPAKQKPAEQAEKWKCPDISSIIVDACCAYPSCFFIFLVIVAFIIYIVVPFIGLHIAIVLINKLLGPVCRFTRALIGI